jgi:hypothetical protein
VGAVVPNGTQTCAALSASGKEAEMSYSAAPPAGSDFRDHAAKAGGSVPLRHIPPIYIH